MWKKNFCRLCCFDWRNVTFLCMGLDCHRPQLTSCLIELHGFSQKHLRGEILRALEKIKTLKIHHMLEEEACEATQQSCIVLLPAISRGIFNFQSCTRPTFKHNPTIRGAIDPRSLNVKLNPHNYLPQIYLSSFISNLSHNVFQIAPLSTMTPP